MDAGREVYWLTQGCQFRQGAKIISAGEAVVWLDRAGQFSLSPHRMTIYGEAIKIAYGEDGPATGSSPVGWEAESWSGDLRSYKPIEFEFTTQVANPPKPEPAIYQRAVAATSVIESPITIAPVQFNQPTSQGIQNPTLFPPLVPQSPIIPGGGNPAGGLNPRRVQVFPRSNVRMQTDSFIVGDERVTIVDSGVNILIEGDGSLGTVDISTDRVIIWQPASNAGPMSGAGGNSKALEFYMEGNIVFRQADRVIYATSMYYNVRQESGVVLDAELLSSIPNYPGVVRLRADVLRQLDRSRFQAHQAALTTSRMGVPRYWFQSGDLAFEDRQQPVIDPFTGGQAVDLQGRPVVKKQRLASSRNNYIYVGEIPVFYWPFLSTDLAEPTNYIKRVNVRNDRVFGTQLGLEFNLNQMFNLGARNPGTDWSASVDYLSERGWGFGTTYDYVLNRFLGIPGEARGFADAWFIDEQGLDNLGADRRGLTPEEDFRGRVLWQHRQRTPSGLQITGELGWVSDRNFLEQYYEREWDQWKDQSTGIELKYLDRGASWNLSTDFRVNDFFTQTEWLPRFDHFQLGQAIGDRLTWFGHSQIGYARLKTASTPTDATDASKFNPLAWEVESEGIRTGARHEIDLPMQLGDVRVVPYALGEVMHWGQDIDGESNTRLMGQAGVRASLPMWSANPNFTSMLFNMNGLAHKVVFEGEFLWADASKNLSQFPLYDQLDDDAIEHFRRRFVDDEFGGTLAIPDLIPAEFDERFFALRRGLQSWVTSPSSEIADDLMFFQLGVRQRWQTKRGLPGQERVVDWMTLDTQAKFFPKANRDNFGEDIGMLQYDWRWHIGDRLTLMSDGYADTFGDGLRMFNLGGYISRPARGSAYVGFRSIEGPISSNVLNASFSYRMSPKWIASVGTAVDFGPTGNIGQVFELTRIGESFLVSVGANIDESRDNVGFNFSIEPRALPLRKRRMVGGVPIAPPGAYGLE